VTPREHIARLEGLLERIAKNATRPRTRRAAPTLLAAAPPALVPSTGPSKPSAPDSAPVVVQVPSVEPAAIGRASDVPPPPSVPRAPPPAVAPSEPFAPPVAAAPPAAAPPPLAFEPPPFAAPPFAAPATVAAGASGISSVPPWKPEPSSTVQARPSSLPPEELSEDDLVEVTTFPPPVAPAPADDIEEPPASSSRSKVAESLDQAIASAAERPDELEVPIHTPPPESGPQEAVLPAGIEAPRAAEFAEVATELVRPASPGPTPEQLGGTIELEGADGPEIEIEVAGTAAPEPEPQRPVEELEVSLPRAEMPSGTYDVSVSMPAEAPLVASSIPTVPVQEHAGPEIMVRPAFEGAEVTNVIRVSVKAPENFGELLDGTLEL
jgi:hypothetical protein